MLAIGTDYMYGVFPLKHVCICIVSSWLILKHFVGVSLSFVTIWILPSSMNTRMCASQNVLLDTYFTSSHDGWEWVMWNMKQTTPSIILYGAPAVKLTDSDWVFPIVTHCLWFAAMATATEQWRSSCVLWSTWSKVPLKSTSRVLITCPTVPSAPCHLLNKGTHI